MDNSRMDYGNLPPVPHQVLLDMAISALRSHLRSAEDALRRAADQAEHVCHLPPSRAYVAKQLERVRRHVKAAEGILVEHGCTVDLDEAMPEPTKVEQLKALADLFTAAGKGGVQ